jgi:asparagine synthase (glutamine-hydrolysing)
MCGINAIYAFHPSAATVDVGELNRSCDAMRLAARRRRPVDQRRPPRRAGHRRLSIIDVSERANQPMRNRTGDLAIVFNGEIYNYQELRGDLMARGEHFDTTSDTEAAAALSP